jgi:hypothetical protein
MNGFEPFHLKNVSLEGRKEQEGAKNIGAID